MLAQVSTADAYTIKQGTDGGDRWREVDKNGLKYTHYYSSYESSKEKALKVDASYGFKLQKTEQTKVSVKKGDACSAPSTFQGSDLNLPNFLKKYTWFKTSENEANDIQIKISNLQIYQCDEDGSNGRWVTVDMVRTVTGIEKYQGENGYVALGTGITNAAYVGLEEVTVNNVFYRAGTSTKVTLKSNVTLNDIDSYQYIGISAAKIDGQYVASNTILSYKKSGNKNVYFADSGTNYDGEAKTAAGFIFEDSSFDYTFGRDGGLDADGNHVDYSSNQEQYVGSGQSMVNITPPNPVKSVSDANETEVTNNTIEHIGDSFTYHVEQAIPSNMPENFYYDNFSFEDQIESCLKILGVKVKAEDADSQKQDVTSMFNISTTGNKVTAALKNPKSAAFYENTVYRLEITVKMDVPEGATEAQLNTLKEKWSSHGHYNETKTVLTEKNSAKTIIDGENKVSNEVITKIKTPVKTVSDDDEKEVKKNSIRSLADDWTYSITQDIAKGAGSSSYYDKFVFKDSVEECMKILSVKVKDNNGNDVSSWFTISTVGNNVTAALKNPKDAAFYQNASYTMEVNVKMNVPENPTEEQLTVLREKWTSHGHYNETKNIVKENNRAFVEINGVNDITNEPETDVHLSTNDEGGSDPGLKITKDVNRYENEVNDIIKYTVKVSNTNKDADTAYFQIKDTSLPDSFALDFSSVKVAGIDEKNYVLTQSGNGWVLKSNGDYALPYGTEITITYEAKALVASNGTCVDNTASAVAAGIPEKSDKEQVYINSPKVDVVKTTPDTKHKVGDTVGYKVEITNRNPGTFMRDIVLNDLVKTEGLEIKEGTVAVLVGGKDVTNAMEISYDEDGKGFAIQTPFNLKNGTIPCIGIAPYSSIANWTDKIVATYDATITDEAAEESNLENVFTAPATKNTNGDVIKDDPEIPSGGGEDTEDVTMKAPALSITKKSNKQEYKVGETGTYTLEVKQTKENLTAKNVVITDTFAAEDGIKVDASSITVMFNGEDITKDCKITAEDRNFSIQTGKDETDEDKITVTYKVTFTKTGEYTNTAVAKSDNTKEDQANNVVEVKEATPDMGIEKASDKTEYTEGETGKYTLKITQKNADATAKNVIVKDYFKQADGLEIQKDTLKVVLNGEDITKDCKTAVNTNDFYIETGKDMTSKDTMTVTYDVLFTKTGTYENKAATLAENAGEKQDDNTVKVVKSDVNMTKDADKKTYKEGENVNYTVSVALKKEGAKAKNVVIKDEVPKELELLKDSVKVQGVKGYAAEVKDNTLTVKIPEMSYGEKATVTYQATVLKTALGKKLTNKATVNGDGINGGNAEVTVEVPKPETPKKSTTTTPGSTTSTPKTGDAGNMVPYAAAIAAAGIAAIVVLRKKKKLKK